MNWAHLIELLMAEQSLSEHEAETLFSAIFDGGVPDLEMGAVLVLRSGLDEPVPVGSRVIRLAPKPPPFGLAGGAPGGRAEA